MPIQSVVVYFWFSGQSRSVIFNYKLGKYSQKDNQLNTSSLESRLYNSQLCVFIDYINDKITLLIQEYNDSMKSPIFNGLSQSKDTQLIKDLQN